MSVIPEEIQCALTVFKTMNVLRLSGMAIGKEGI
jgi:hypothetical protein